MMRSLYSGISSLRNFQLRMDVIGNNIANINTVGFKGSRAAFADVMAQNLAGATPPSDTVGGTNPMQVGLGMATAALDTRFAQGALESTGITTDLAIQGDGFFIVSDGRRNLLTRAGTFNLDGRGNLVYSANGYRVQGYSADETGQLNRSAVSDIVIPLGRRSPARATSEVTLSGNLDVNMTNSHATLADAGTTGITLVSGLAAEGVGGSHSVEITGANATRSQGSGFAQNLDLNDTLADLGVTSATGLTVTVDGSRTVTITGLTASSTVGQLLNALNRQVSGIHAELDENGAIRIRREYYGDGSTYYVTLTDTDGGDIVANLLDADGTFEINNGTAATLSAVDHFTPTGATAPMQRVLELVTDARTGLVTGLSGLGGGGVTITAPEGLAAGTAVITTADTSHIASVFVYDSLGNSHSLTLTFTRTVEPGVWNWSAQVPEPSVVVSGASGKVRFDADGSLDSWLYDDDADGFTFTPGAGAQDVTVRFNAGTVGGFDGLTQTASAATAAAVGQNGFGMGTLLGIEIDTDGRIIGNFSNGAAEVLAQVLTAVVGNPQGLERVGENLFASTTNSGSLSITDAESAGSKISSGYLEMSNVDLSQEFADLIVTQRAFQAAAKVITTSDLLLQELVNLKR